VSAATQKTSVVPPRDALKTLENKGFPNKRLAQKKSGVKTVSFEVLYVRRNCCHHHGDEKSTVGFSIATRRQSASEEGRNEQRCQEDSC
jgi:hypothetical protein